MKEEDLSRTCPSMTILENLAIADNKGKAYGLGRGTNHARMDEIGRAHV